MDNELLEKYLKHFGDNPPFPPEHIMESLVQMKESGTYNELLEKYLNHFGDKPPFPPDHIMETLVQMKESGTYDDTMNKINPFLGEMNEKIEALLGEKMSTDHPIFDVNFNDEEKRYARKKSLWEKLKGGLRSIVGR